MSLTIQWQLHLGSLPIFGLLFRRTLPVDEPKPQPASNLASKPSPLCCCFYLSGLHWNPVHFWGGGGWMNFRKIYVFGIHLKFSDFQKICKFKENPRISRKNERPLPASSHLVVYVLCSLICVGEASTLILYSKPTFAWELHSNTISSSTSLYQFVDNKNHCFLQ